MPLSRRNFFRLLSAAPALAARAADSGLIIRSQNPEDFEMPLDGFTTWITPADRFFVRTHLYKPNVDANQWKLQRHRAGGQCAHARYGRPEETAARGTGERDGVRRQRPQPLPAHSHRHAVALRRGGQCALGRCAPGRRAAQSGNAPAPSTSCSMARTCRWAPCRISCAPFRSPRPCIPTRCWRTK